MCFPPPFPALPNFETIHQEATHLTVKASLASVLGQVPLAAVISVENTASADQLPLEHTSVDKQSGSREKGKKRRTTTFLFDKKKKRQRTKRLPFPVLLTALRSALSQYLVF